MFGNAKNSKIVVKGSDMHYISFGKGNQNLIIIAGLGDALKPVRGQAQSLALAYYYKEYIKNFKVYIFGRRNNLPVDYTIKDMSDDQIIALNNLGLHSVNVMGISQGGMIAQQMAVSYPYMVKKLVIVVSCFQVHRNAQISLKPLD